MLANTYLATDSAQLVQDRALVSAAFPDAYSDYTVAGSIVVWDGEGRILAMATTYKQAYRQAAQAANRLLQARAHRSEQATVGFGFWAFAASLAAALVVFLAAVVALSLYVTLQLSAWARGHVLTTVARNPLAFAMVSGAAVFLIAATLHSDVSKPGDDGI